ncbi:MAG: DUF2680 domain-containing protein, partial [Sedimentibacter sp.]
MKKFKKIAVVILVVFAFAATSLTAFAYTNNSPAQIVSELTGNSIEEVTAVKNDNDITYGQIAYDEGLWEEFNTEMLESKKAFLQEKVTDGTLTQEEADAIYANIEARQETCNGNGTGGYGG